jgi:hypothetical protein
VRLNENCNTAAKGTSNDCIHYNFSRAVSSRGEHIICATAVEEKPGNPENKSASDNISLIVWSELVSLVDKPLLEGHVIILVDMFHDFLVLFRMS